MYPTPQHEKIAALVEPMLARSGDLYLVDVEIAGTRVPTVWVYLESQQGGISLDACAAVSRELSVLLDAHEVFEGAFRLNVSSPGLDRPLRKMRQYETNSGRNVKVTRMLAGVRNVVRGRLAAVSADAVTIETTEGAVTVPFSEITETKVLPAF